MSRIATSPGSRTALLALGLVLYGAVVRLLPHPPNFTPTGALCLLGGMALPGRWWPWLVPLGALFLSDLVLGLYGLMPVTYGTWLLVVLWGRLLRERGLGMRVVAGALGASLIFYLVTNFACWLTMPQYSKDWAGLVQCYVAALPFMRNMLLADLTYTTLLCQVWELGRRWHHVPAAAS